MYQYHFIDCNKCITPMQVLLVGELGQGAPGREEKGEEED